MKCIYLRTNLVNGKQYVGQTVDFKDRECGWRTRKKYSGGAIDNARNKYGVENFKVDILRECQTQEELNEWEIYYIAKLNTKVPNGYNITDGGGGMSGFKHSEEDKAKMSKSMEGRKNHFYGKHHSEETKKLISHNNSGNKNGMFGKHLSDISKKKLSDLMRGRHIPHPKARKKVYQYTLDGKLVKVWDSLEDCKAEEYVTTTKGISSCCHGRAKTYKGYKWSYIPL